MIRPGYVGELSGYAFPTGQSDRVTGIGHCPSRTRYGQVQVTKTRPCTRMVVFGIGADYGSPV